MGVTGHRTEVRQRLQFSGSIVGGVTTVESGVGKVVVREMEIAFAVGQLPLDRIMLEYIETRRQHQAPAKNALIAQGWTIGPNVPQDRRKLDVAHFGILPAHVETTVGSMIDGRNIRLTEIINLRGWLLNTKVYLPMLIQGEQVAHGWLPREDH